jgi:predicted Zn-dependent protease
MTRPVSAIWIMTLLVLTACQQQAAPPSFAVAAAAATGGTQGGPPIAMPSLASDGSAIPHLQPAERPPLSSDEGGLWMLADRAEESLKTSGSRVRDPALNAYVQNIACRLAGPYCADIRVYVMRQPGFNAAMFPNGAMVVWTGLLLRSRNEAQVASVIGHEIGHYLRRHSVQGLRDVRDKTTAGLFLTMGFGMFGVAAAGDLVQIGLLGSIFAFSRDNEREADDIGIRIMARASYDPREATRVWENLRAELAKDDASRGRMVFFATHPEPEERQETLRAAAETLMATIADPRLGREEHQTAIGPHRLGFLTDELRHRRFARLEALFTMLASDGYRTGEVRYAEGEMYRLRGDEGDDAKALEAYRAAETLGGTPVDLYRSVGLVHLRQGEHAKAVSAFTRYLELNPGATDREMIRMMMKPPAG